MTLWFDFIVIHEGLRLINNDEITILFFPKRKQTFLPSEKNWPSSNGESLSNGAWDKEILPGPK